MNDIQREGKLTEIPGVGKAIAEKIDELLSTGKLEFLEKLEAEVPPALVEVLQVPDLGPKKAALFWKQAGVTNLAELEAAARAGKLRYLPGMGEKSEARILAGIEALARRSGPHPAGQGLAVRPALLARLRGRARSPGGGSGRQPAAHARHRRRYRPAGGRQRLAGGDGGLHRPPGRDAGGRARARPKPAWSSATTCAPSCGCTRRSALARPCSTPPARKITTCGCASWR